MTGKMKTVYFSLVVLAFLGSSQGLYERWLPNTDLKNPFNWDAGRVPCGNDRIVIPDDSPVVFYQINTTIRELVLPHTGEFVFGAYATLAFTNEPDHSAACLGSGGDVHFNASHPASWIDPQNWCPTDTETGPCKDLAQLDTETIPCTTDDVIFPTGSSYYVSLGTALSIIINTIKVSGKAYSTQTFTSFVNSDNGKNIFAEPPGGQMSGVTIQRQRCTDPTGCPCGNDHGPILDAVCRVQTPRCQRPRCSTSIRPVGHCCNVCGAQLNLTYGVGFDLNKLRTGLQRTSLDGKDAYKDVSYIVSKRSDGQVQVILYDVNGQQSSAAGRDMLTQLTNDINTGGFTYGVNKVTMKASVGSGGGTGTGGNTSALKSHTSLPGGEVAGITIGVILAALVLLVLAFFAYRRRSSPMDELGFRVFDRFNLKQKRKPQVSVPPSVGFSWNTPENVGFSQQGFDNPMFGSTPLQVVKSIELTPTSYSDPLEQTQPIDDSRGFDNPLYDNQESLFSDPTKVDNPELDTVMTLSGSNKLDNRGDTDA